jgi:hypothetical protein
MTKIRVIIRSDSSVTDYRLGRISRNQLVGQQPFDLRR